MSQKEIWMKFKESFGLGNISRTNTGCIHVPSLTKVYQIIKSMATAAPRNELATTDDDGDDTNSSSSRNNGSGNNKKKLNEFAAKWKPPHLESGFSSKVQALVDDTTLGRVQVQFIHDWHKHRTGRDITLKALLEECERYENGQLVLPDQIRKLTVGPGGGSRGVSTAGSEDVDVVDGQLTDVAAAGDTGSGSRGAGSGSARRTSPPSQPTNQRTPPRSGRAADVVSDVVSDSALSEQSASSVSSVSGGVNSGVSGVTAAMSEVEINVVPGGIGSLSSSRNSSRSGSSGVGGGNSADVVALPPAHGSADNDRVARMSPLDRERWMLQQRLLALQREHDILDMARKCSSCRTRPRDITFLPCGHFTMCKTCSEPVYECPTCQKDILATAQTYLS